MSSKKLGIPIATVLLLAVTLPLILLLTGATRYKVYVVHTGSMSPTIPSTSAVIVREGEYHLGKVVTFSHRGQLVTHRLVARNADGTFSTKGDGNSTVDPWTIQPSQIVGQVVAAPSRLGYWLVYFKNAAGAGSLLMAMISVGLIFSITTDLAESAPVVSRTRRPAQHRQVPIGRTAS
jgi:signal peptidase